MRARLEYQAGHAIVWRDAIVQYFLKLSGIPDEQRARGELSGQAGSEDARLTGYKVIDVKPWEDASGGKAVSCEGQAQCCCRVDIFRRGRADSILRCNTSICKGAMRSLRSRQWAAGGRCVGGGCDSLPSRQPHGDNSMRHVVRGVALKPGDVIRIEGAPDGTMRLRWITLRWCQRAR